MFSDFKEITCFQDIDELCNMRHARVPYKKKRVELQ